MRGHRVGEVSELPYVGRGVNVNALGEVVVRRVGGCKVGGQTAVHGRVHELGALREQKLAEVVHGEPRLLHRVRDRHGLEVTAMVHLASLTVNERVVSGYRRRK